MSIEHSLLTPTDVHGIVGGLGPYTSVALRQAAVVAATDVGKVAIQTVSGVTTLWWLQSQTAGVPAWLQINTTADTGGGGGGGGGGGSGPLTVMSGHVKAGYIPETGLTSTSWADQSGNGHNLAGTWTVQTNQINTYSCAKANGTSDAAAVAFSVPVPGTTPQYVYCVVRIDTYANNIGICALSSGGASAVLMHTATDQVSQHNGSSYSNVNAAGCTVGSFKLIKAKYTNTTADSIKAGGGTLVTGTSNGNTLGGGVYLFNFAGSFAAVSIAEYWLFDSDPGTSLDSYFTTKFPGCET